jgi:hypothetical protein
MLILIITVLVFQYRSAGPDLEIITINELAEEIKSGQVIRLIIDESEVQAIFKDGSSASSRIDPIKDTIEQLNDFGVSTADLSPDSIQVEYREFGSSIQNILIGVAIGGLTGVIVGASLMRLYIEFRSKNSTQ